MPSLPELKLPDNPDRAWFDERVEAYVDADLPPAEMSVFAERLRRDGDLRRQVAIAERISLSLAARPRPVALPPLRDRLAAIPTTPDRFDRRSAGLSVVRMLRWPAGLAAAAALAFLTIRIGIDAPTHGAVPAATPYTQAEIDKALREAKYALAIVSDAGKHAGQTVRETVIRRNVVDPVNRAFEATVFGPEAPTN